MDGNRKKRSVQTTNILKLCFIVCPTDARKIVKDIYSNDYKILNLSNELSKNMGRADLEIIKDIENVRAHNNTNWMNLIRLAFEHAPDEAKEIMSSINQDDEKVTKLLEELSNEKK